ncbi:DUF5953 family protein [Chitinophaga pinensis]|uniref:Uncharacterized protein n=1 Tax=Chitinophaga pinensis (strain ATCC 43595 / DSM 2588 / LMG 13176 / NBRC 15968 / NCIMB 11800 / UQM 2034) TaxID=485918 RepID=A0A979GAH0_CHIPD|nr:DUF5953 family protein [Chitinophaga pinensis]ACU63713.1 hypothetical protein Cpin_6308 [Chitinophaga pinensis DSM 2588]
MSLHVSTLQLFRQKEADSLPRFLDLVQTCNDHSEATRLQYIYDGNAYNEYTSPAALEKAFADLEQFWDKGDYDKDVILFTDREHPLFSLVHTDPFEYTHEDTAAFTFNGGRPLLQPQGHFSYDTFHDFFVAAIDAYKATYAAVYDTDLETLISFASFYGEVEIDEEISTPEIVLETPEQLTARIGRVISPELFNPLEIPPAIYWFNYWNEAQVKAVGEEKIKQAPFEVIEKRADGGYILVVQKENFDTHNTAHLERLAALYDHFDLYSLQQGDA